MEVWYRWSLHFLCPTELENSLQARLSSISRRQLAEGQNIQNIADTADDIKQQKKTYTTTMKEVQGLIEEMKRQLEEARSNLRSAVRY